MLKNLCVGFCLTLLCVFSGFYFFPEYKPCFLKSNCSSKAFLMPTSYEDDIIHLLDRLNVFPDVKISKLDYVQPAGDDELLFFVIFSGHRFFVDLERQRIFAGGDLFGFLPGSDDVVNVSVEYTKMAHRTFFEQMDASKAVVQKTGNGTHQYAVFLSLSCIHCVRQFEEYSKLEDATIYYYFIPLGDETDAHIHRIFQNEHSLELLRDWYANGAKHDGQEFSYDTEVAPGFLEALRAIHTRSGVVYAPTTITRDGQVFVGVITKDYLLENTQLAFVEAE